MINLIKNTYSQCKKVLGRVGIAHLDQNLKLYNPSKGTVKKRANSAP